MTDLEITRTLAEKVMSWEAASYLDNADLPLRDSLGDWLYDAPRYFVAGNDVGLVGEGKVIWPWNPLASISDAWMVRDRLAKVGKLKIENSLGGFETQCLFMLIATSSPRGYYEFEASDESASRAICYVALKAIGVNPEPEK